MVDVTSVLVNGSNKVIDHYKRLLASTNAEEERQLYIERIEREQKLLSKLQTPSQRVSL